MGDDLARWRERAARELKGADPDGLVWATPEGIDVSPLYTADDVPGDGWPGLPGEAPFTRGVRAEGRMWIGWSFGMVNSIPTVTVAPSSRTNGAATTRMPPSSPLRLNGFPSVWMSDAFCGR